MMLKKLKGFNRLKINYSRKILMKFSFIRIEKYNQSIMMKKRKESLKFQFKKNSKKKKN